MITPKRLIFVISFISSFSFFLMAGLTFNTKYLDTGITLLAISSVLQLELSGLFSDVINELKEASKKEVYPSHLTQQAFIIPYEAPYTKYLEYIFLDKHFGFYLGMVSLALQLVSIWVH